MKGKYIGSKHSNIAITTCRVFSLQVLYGNDINSTSFGSGFPDPPNPNGERDQANGGGAKGSASNTSHRSTSAEDEVEDLGGWNLLALPYLQGLEP